MPTINKLLIANRGEIACRIMRTARAMGIRTVAVYSDADRSAQHVRHADEAVHIGAAPAQQSYLDMDKVIGAAKQRGADAIHPGYGFLSENAAFADAVASAGLVFIGPPAAAISSMGSKSEAKALMSDAGVPILPGYHGEDQSPELLAAEAEKIGYPLLIKASAGGGGKGMRIVRSADAFADELAGAQREAQAAFSSDQVLLERYLTAPKHIEVQVLADTHGNVVHLFERDCSVQRRHQKVVEEAPAPTVTAQMREQLGAAAVDAARRVGYVGAGTVEFIAEGDEFFFMEMNTRLQVEHPVTEAITNLDLVEWQLRVAAGEPLPEVLSEQIQAQRIHGHAVEVRLYAENPANRFLPSTGTLQRFDIGLAGETGVRLDSGVVTGDVVSPHYDPMLAKLICHGATRAEAMAKLREVLASTQIAGIAHNVGYLREVLALPAFADGSYTTNDAEAAHDALIGYASDNAQRVALVLAALALSSESDDEATVDPWAARDGFRVNSAPKATVTLALGKTHHTIAREGSRIAIRGAADGTEFELGALELACAGNGDVQIRAEVDGISHRASVQRADGQVHVYLEGHTVSAAVLTDDLARYRAGSTGAGGVTSPMPGQVLSVTVEAGQTVQTGDVLAIVEAMKMEHSIRAPHDAKVEAVLVSAGDRVNDGQALVKLAED